MLFFRWWRRLFVGAQIVERISAALYYQIVHRDIIVLSEDFELVQHIFRKTKCFVYHFNFFDAEHENTLLQDFSRI